MDGTALAPALPAQAPPPPPPTLSIPPPSPATMTAAAAPSVAWQHPPPSVAWQHPPPPASSTQQPPCRHPHGSRGPGRAPAKSNRRSFKKKQPAQQQRGFIPGLKTRLVPPPKRELAQFLIRILDEPKHGLIHRVVRLAGHAVAWNVLIETLRLEESGSVRTYHNTNPSGVLGLAEVMSTAPAPSSGDSATQALRRRGGVYLSTLKNHVPRELYKEIFAIEDQKKKNCKKLAKQRRMHAMQAKLSGLGFEDLAIDDVQECNEESATEGSCHDMEEATA